MRRSWLVPMVVAPLLAADGWRHGGMPIWPDATPAAPVDVAHPAWSVATPGWGNSTPVRVGDQWCMTSEPTWVHCHDAATGALRWKATNDRLDTLGGAARDAKAAELATFPAVDAALRQQVREVSRLRQQVRAADDPDAAARAVSAASEALDVTKARYDALHAWLTPPELDMIGWASPTVATDGTALAVLTGNGVVSVFEGDGRRRWSVWQGPPVRPMRGFDYGEATSPLWVDGRIIVGHGHLTARDATTGTVVWQDAATWDHYGTPAVARVGGQAVLATPDGRLIRARDGAVLAKDLAALTYVGPVAQGDHVWFFGGAAADRPGDVHASGWVLEPDGDGVRARNLFRATLPRKERVYTSPVVADGRLYGLLLDNTLVVLDATTGAVRSETSQETPSTTPLGAAYANPTLAGGALWLVWERGTVRRLQPGDAPSPIDDVVLPEQIRASPTFDGRRTCLRTLTHLTCYGG